MSRFFFKQKTAYEIGLGIPAEPLFRSQRNQSAAFSSGRVRPNNETNINIIARRTGKDVNSHTVLDGIITTIMATIQRINIIGSRVVSRNRRRLKANETGKKYRVGIKRQTTIESTLTTIIATIQRINIQGRRKSSPNQRTHNKNQTGNKFRFSIKSNISTNRKNLIIGVNRCIHLNAMKKTTNTSINRQ